MAIVRLHETDGDITKKRILEEIDRRYGTPPKGRARLFADTEPVIREAVAEMRRDQTKLAWLNVAARITKMTDVYVSTSTLHDWCRRDKLPHPGQPYWQRPARQV